MQIRPDRAADTTPLPAARPVVAETRDDPPKGLRARVESGPAGVVLEAGERLLHTRFELTLEQDVADHARVAGHGLEREEPDPWKIDAVKVAVGATE